MFMVLLILTGAIFGDAMWTHAINIYVTISGGTVPVGDNNLSIPNEAHDDYLEWRQNGLWFMTWITKMPVATPSDTFFPGDQDYNHYYWGDIGGMGMYSFACDAFKTWEG
jgi:hypothetical protein